ELEIETLPRFHQALTESACVLAEALGLALDDVLQTGGVIRAPAPAMIAGIDVRGGAVLGFDQAVVATAGRTTLKLSWLGVPNPESQGLTTGGVLELEGADGGHLHVQMTVPADPYPGTAARMLRSIPALQRLAPGLHTPAGVHGLHV